MKQCPLSSREMSDDEAVIAMVDANLQREHILPSEKAFAYKMKLDAIKHQGVTSAQVGQKLLSVEKVAEDAGESRNQVKRYIRLTYLIPELLEMADENKNCFQPCGRNLILRPVGTTGIIKTQWSSNDCTPSHAQTIRLKKLSQEGVLQDRTIYDILAEQKPNQQEQYKLSGRTFAKYFPKSYTDKAGLHRSSSCWNNGSADGKETETAADSNFVRLQQDESHRGKNGTGRVQWPCRCRTVRECQIQRTEVKQIWYQDIYRLKRDTTTPC